MTEDPGHSPKPEDHKEWAAAIKRHQTRQKALDWKEEEHPGCQISGFLFVDRVPGNFHIQGTSTSFVFLYVFYLPCCFRIYVPIPLTFIRSFYY
jgi:hypothetical protein